MIAAARQIAIAEDRAIFHGYKAAHITGICEAAASTAVPLGSSHADYPGAVSAALTKLRDEGIEGPFAVVLNEQLYKDLAARTDSGYPILSHVQRLVDGDIVWAAGLDGGLVLSKRGGDFELTVGQDFSIGYLEHNLRARAALHRGELHLPGPHRPGRHSAHHRRRQERLAARPALAVITKGMLDYRHDDPAFP